MVRVSIGWRCQRGPSPAGGGFPTARSAQPPSCLLASPCVSVAYTVILGLFILLKYIRVTKRVGLRPQEGEAGSLPLGRSPDRKLNVVFYADPRCCPLRSVGV